jgi:hypothetical protein
LAEVAQFLRITPWTYQTLQQAGLGSTNLFAGVDIAGLARMGGPFAFFR